MCAQPGDGGGRRRRGRATLTVALVVGLVVALAGCGSAAGPGASPAAQGGPESGNTAPGTPAEGTSQNRPGTSASTGEDPGAGHGVESGGEQSGPTLADARAMVEVRWPGRAVRTAAHSLVVGTTSGPPAPVVPGSSATDAAPTNTSRTAAQQPRASFVAPAPAGTRGVADEALGLEPAEVSRTAEEAWRRCRAVWPRDEAVPPLVVVLPSGRGGASGVDHGGGEDARPAATTVTDGEAPTAETWIVLAPEAWGDLSEEGRAVVLTHECVHVTLAARARPTSPRWLVEGIADDLAYRRSTVPVEAVLTPVAEDVAEHGPPRHLPTDEEFEVAGAGREAVLLAYARALSAVRTYTSLHGADAAVDLVRGRGGAQVEEGTLEAELLPAWQDALARDRSSPGSGSDRSRPARQE